MRRSKVDKPRTRDTQARSVGDESRPGSGERVHEGAVLPPESAGAFAGSSENTPVPQRTRVPGEVARVSSSGDEPSTMVSVPPEAVPLSHYKGTSLKNVGRDSKGRVIPHKRSETTAKLVKIWAAGGYTKEDIAIRLNIRPGLVEECYGKELRHGGELIGMDMTSHIVKRAIVDKSDRMAIFYAKAKMGWRDGESKPLDTGLLNIHIHT